MGSAISVNYGRKDDSLLLIVSGDIGWEGNERFSNEALGHLRFVRRVSNRVHFEGFIQSNYDKSRNLDFRAVAGVGIRWRIAGSVGSGLWFGNSYMFEHEQNGVAPADPHLEETSVSRWSNYGSASVRISDTATVSGTVYYQPNFTRFGDFRVLADAHLNVSITATLALTTSISVHHDSDPVGSVSESDYQLTTGISIKW